jgi:hypothetical protein
MAMMIYPNVLLNSHEYKSRSNINSNLNLARGYWGRYLNGESPQQGDVPQAIIVSDRYGFPDAIGFQDYWFLLPKLFEFFSRANGSEWPLRACDIVLRTKAAAEAKYCFLWGPPRFHRYNHDPQTYPHPKRPSQRNDGVIWARMIGGDSGRTMRPPRDGDPHFWEDAGAIVGDTIWGGGELRWKYVSDKCWKELQAAFPDAFRTRPIPEKELPATA